MGEEISGFEKTVVKKNTVVKKKDSYCPDEIWEGEGKRPSADK